jgi:hypothetical protein
MKSLITLFTIVFSSYFSFSQDPSVFTWDQVKMDATTKRTHKVKYTEKKIGKKGIIYLKYVFEPEGNLLGVVYTYQDDKLLYITPFYLSTPAFIYEVERKIYESKGTSVLYRTDTEMAIYNKEKKIYTVLYIDTDLRLLYMCHSLSNPMEKIIIKKST